MNLLKDAAFESVMDNQSAGQTEVFSSIVDMQGYDNVCFVTKLGTLSTGAVVGVSIQQGAESTMSDAAALLGTNIAPAATDDDKLLVHDISRPQERYVRVRITRDTANAEIDSVIAIKYPARAKPVTQDTDHVASSELHLSPAEGTI